jgi:glycerol-3-phosphate dehydrogenase
VQTQVLIIGGGATGTAVARDLALRGVACVLVEKDDINAGASGRNHGLLHSGARYATNDREAARECAEEGALLKRLAPQCVQDTGGLFVAIEGDDERFVADFPGHCEKSGIAARAVDPATARALEPCLSERVIAAYEVPDASIDPFKLSLEHVADARRHGGALLRKTAVVGFEREGRRIRAARLLDRRTGEERRVACDVVVNAAGAWAREVAALVGIDVPILYSKGTLIITHGRLAWRVINRLRPPSNADIMMPGGTVSIIGTTSVSVPSLDPADVRPTVAEVDLIVDEAAALIPPLATARCIRAYAGVRPLVSASRAAEGRAVSRGFALLDHARDGVDNLVTITGGKLTTCRLMAERTADAVCAQLGVTAPCRTHLEPLPATPECEWTEPGLSPREWMRAHAPDDALVCECEMVARSAVDSIVRSLRDEGRTPTLTDIGVRSRIGKGACQGTFCAVRTAAWLYETGAWEGGRGLAEVLDLYRERWRGQHSVLWGAQLAQAELMEAVHCGLFGVDLHAPATTRRDPEATR